MIRPFDLRDLALVHRLSEQGVALHTESALTNHLNPLRDALFSMVGGNYPTLVWKVRKGTAVGFIQLYMQEDDRHARVLYVGSEDTAITDNAPQIDADIWLPLLDQAVVEIGRRGIHSLVAEVNETGPELPVLRQAGFAVYTRQDIFWLDAAASTETAVTGDHHGQINLHPRRPGDDWDVQLLYGNLVPRLVQLVEPVPTHHPGEGWLLRENGELAAFIQIRAGSTATWMRLYIHPNADVRADDVIAAAVKVARKKAVQPIYCCVRRYQSWLRSPMERSGFNHWGSQAVMVKHTVHHSTKPLPDLSTVMDAQHIPASSPMVQNYRQKED